MEHQTTYTLWDSLLKSEHIIDAFFRMATAPSDVYRWYTVRHIANALGIPKSTRLHKLLQSMFAEAMLEFRTQRLPNGVDGHLYRLSKKYIESLP